MSNAPQKQNPDGRQGGEGTRSLHNQGWSPMLKNIGTPPGNTQAPEPPKDVGTK